MESKKNGSIERTELKCIDHIPFLSALIFWNIILAASRNTRQVSLLFDRKLVPSTVCGVTWPQKRPSLKIARVTVVLLVSPERNLH
jgi:hypothetical protein